MQTTKADEVDVKVMSSGNLEKLYQMVLDEITNRGCEILVTEEIPFFEGEDREIDPLPTIKPVDPVSDFMKWDSVQAAAMLLLIIGAFALAFYR